MDIKELLKEFDRVPLTRLPTPLDYAENLTELLGGPKIFFKRDFLNYGKRFIRRDGRFFHERALRLEPSFSANKYYITINAVCFCVGVNNNIFTLLRTELFRKKQNKIQRDIRNVN